MAPLGFRLATIGELVGAGLGNMVVEAAVSSAPAFNGSGFLSSSTLAAGALLFMKRHFDALNCGDREAFRSTAWLTPVTDGLPFETWWNGMKGLCPLSVALEVEKVDFKARSQRRTWQRINPSRVAPLDEEEHDLHLNVKIQAEAISGATGQSYSDSFSAWYLLRTGEWKLGCRIHWWLS